MTQKVTESRSNSRKEADKIKEKKEKDSPMTKVYGEMI